VSGTCGAYTSRGRSFLGCCLGTFDDDAGAAGQGVFVFDDVIFEEGLESLIEELVAGEVALQGEDVQRVHEVKLFVLQTRDYSFFCLLYLGNVFLNRPRRVLNDFEDAAEPELLFVDVEILKVAREQQKTDLSVVEVDTILVEELKSLGLGEGSDLFFLLF